MYYTLQDFLTHTEGVTYLLILVALAGIAGFWFYLNGRDEDDH